MNNPFFQAMGGGMPQGNIRQSFEQFKAQFPTGTDPQAAVMQMLQSGRISQQQLTQAQQKMQQFKGVLW